MSGNKMSIDILNDHVQRILYGAGAAISTGFTTFSYYSLNDVAIIMGILSTILMGVLAFRKESKLSIKADLDIVQSKLVIDSLKLEIEQSKLEIAKLKDEMDYLINS
jgi:hypothetical protein